ncbi:unnamed protein product, partial [Ilex paraguariensis]
MSSCDSVANSDRSLTTKFAVESNGSVLAIIHCPTNKPAMASVNLKPSNPQRRRLPTMSSLSDMHSPSINIAHHVFPKQHEQSLHQ